MFKNRVRTAALAGAIAVATGVSGIVVVPANAQDTAQGTTDQTDNRHNVPDGSKGTGAAVDRVPGVAVKGKEAHTILGGRLTEVGDWIEKHRSHVLREKDARGTYDIRDYINNPTSSTQEEALMKDAQAQRDAVTAELEVASKNLRDLTATVEAAAAEAKSAREAWNAYAASVAITKKQQKELEKFFDTDGAGEHLPALFGSINIHDGSGYPGGLAAPADQLANTKHQQTAGSAAPKKNAAIVPHAVDTGKGQTDFVADVEKSAADLVELKRVVSYYAKNIGAAGTPDATRVAGVQDRQLIAELAALQALLDGFTTGDPVALNKAAIAKTAAAQEYNLGELQKLHDKAMAQVRVLRELQAYYGVAARYFELYENDALTNDERTGIREAYLNTLIGRDFNSDVALFGGNTFFMEVEQQIEALKTAGDDQNKLIEVAPSPVWEPIVSRLRQLDLKYNADAVEDQAAREAREAQLRAEAEFRTNLNKALADIAAALAAQKTPAPGGTATETSTATATTTTTPTAPNQDNGSADNGSTDNGEKKLSTGAIVGIVVGVLAALAGIVAVAFPQIQQFLPR